MPSQETLELIAQVTDRFSQPIRQMGEALAELSKGRARLRDFFSEEADSVRRNADN
jgi:hypothetical protein